KKRFLQSTKIGKTEYTENRQAFQQFILTQLFTFSSRTDLSLIFIGAAALFLPLFAFLPELVQRAVKEKRIPGSRCPARTGR
ncbi:MAG TPA: hypothetical protein PKZ65_08765, partial [Methanoregulaceae archaeon]|nr:hypothetical protein [Methanoregulaceae archaeon]